MATTTKKAANTNSNDKKDFKAIMAESGFSTSKGNSLKLYRADLMEGTDSSLQKRMRRKIRTTRDKFFAEFLASEKDHKKLKDLQTRWLKWATQVYQDVNLICSDNTSESDKAIARKFVKAMQETY